MPPLKHCLTIEHHNNNRPIHVCSLTHTYKHTNTLSPNQHKPTQKDVTLLESLSNRCETCSQVAGVRREVGIPAHAKINSRTDTRAPFDKQTPPQYVTVSVFNHTA